MLAPHKQPNSPTRPPLLLTAVIGPLLLGLRLAGQHVFYSHRVAVGSRRKPRENAGHVANVDRFAHSAPFRKSVAEVQSLPYGSRIGLEGKGFEERGEEVIKRTREQWSLEKAEK